MTEYKLYHGDCIEIMEKLSEDGIKVDLILTDPPYGTTSCKWDTVIPLDDMWRCIKEIRNDKTPTILFGAEPFGSTLRMSNIKEYKYDWIWDKEVGTGCFTQKYQPLSNYETVSVFYKQAGQYYPIMERAKKNKSFKRNKVSSNTMNINLKKQKDYIDDGWRYPKRILKFNNQKNECNNLRRVHPTQKPVALLEYLIKTYTEPQNIVLDFTMGSGSTGVACMNLNRNFIGIELDKEYFEIAEDRIKEANKSRQAKLV